MSEEVQSYLVARLTIQVQLSMLAELPTVCTKSMHTPSYQGNAECSNCNRNQRCRYSESNTIQDNKGAE